MPAIGINPQSAPSDSGPHGSLAVFVSNKLASCSNPGHKIGHLVISLSATVNNATRPGKRKMQIQELELAYLPMEDAAFEANPFAYLGEVRGKHPWLAKCAFGYVVHEYAAMQDLLLMDGQIQAAYAHVADVMGTHGTPWGRWTENHMLAVAGDTHKRMRDVLVPKFTPRKANQNRALMRQVISALLDEWVPKGEFDFEEFAAFFPITVMCTMIGAPPSVIPTLHRSLEALGLSASMKREHVPALQTAFIQMDEFVQQLVADRRAGQRPGAQPDMLDDLIAAEDEGGLSDRELYDLLIFLFVAGYDTSKNMLTFIMNALIDHPEDYEKCAVDPEFCRKVMDETFRYNSVGTAPRLAAEEVTYRGVTIPQGTALFFPLSISGRDPSSFQDPENFNPHLNRDKRHLAFGRGMHICLGQFIARAQIEEGLHLIAQRIKNPHRAGPSGWRPFFGTWGMRGLPITFTPADRPH